MGIPTAMGFSFTGTGQVRCGALTSSRSRQPSASLAPPVHADPVQCTWHALPVSLTFYFIALRPRTHLAKHSQVPLHYTLKRGQSGKPEAVLLFYIFKVPSQIYGTRAI